MFFGARSPARRLRPPQPHITDDHGQGDEAAERHGEPLGIDHALDVPIDESARVGLPAGEPPEMLLGLRQRAVQPDRDAQDCPHDGGDVHPDDRTPPPGQQPAGGQEHQERQVDDHDALGEPSVQHLVDGTPLPAPGGTATPGRRGRWTRRVGWNVEELAEHVGEAVVPGEHRSMPSVQRPESLGPAPPALR